MKRPSLVSQGSLNRILQAAELAWRQKDFQQNIELLERASLLAPSNIGIHLQLGRMYGLRFDYAAAERCFGQAVRVSPRKTEALALAGAHCRDLRNPELGERYLRRAAEQKDATPEMLADLAELYERRRRTTDAAQLIERALQMNPTSPLALLGRARLERQAGHLAMADQILRAFPANADRLLCVRAGYELGGILDRQGRYDEAMATILKAKSLLKPDSAPWAASLQTIHARLQALAQTFNPEIFKRWLDDGTKLQPTRRLALLGGHPRSGTTLLEQVLDSHPDMVSAEETEIFLNEIYTPLTRSLPPNSLMLPVLETAQTDTLLSARATYFRSMELSLGQPLNGRMLIDKNPSLTFLIPALVRVFPEIKLIIAMRDPRDVVLSCFMQPFFQIGQTSSAYLTLVGTVEEYAAVMGVWLGIKAILKNPWIEVRYEDMVEDLESVARQTLGFLDVPWDAGVLGFDEHARKKAVRSPTYADVAKPVYKTAMGRWHHYQKFIEPHLERLTPFVRAFGYEQF